MAYETGNALVKLVLRELMELQDALRKLKLALSTPTLEFKEPDMQKTAEHAAKLGVTFYEASYIQFSRELNIPLITADQKLYEKSSHACHTIYAPELSP